MKPRIMRYVRELLDIQDADRVVVRDEDEGMVS